MSTGVPSETAAVQSQANMSSTAGTGSAAELGIENTNFKTAAGVQLTDRQRVLVGSVLDVSFDWFFFKVKRSMAMGLWCIGI